jgi:RNA polymerase sigma-70 factor (ECF subfamily)
MRLESVDPQAGANLGASNPATPSEVFFAGLARRGLRPPLEREALECELDALCRRARQSLPEIELPIERFAAHVAERVDDDDPLAALRRMAGEDLYLACACGGGDRAALRRFEAELMPQVDKVLRSFPLDAVLSDEIKQAVRVKLFLSPSGPSGIAGYAGRGPLGGWLRVVTVRTALEAMRKARRNRTVVVDLPELLPAEELDPELRYLKEAYRHEFSKAFAQAVDSIGDQERTLLALSWVDRLDAGRIAPLFGVHRSTITRWLGRLQDKLFRRTMSGMAARLRVDPAQARSIARMVRSRIQLSLTRHLGRQARAPAETPAKTTA